MSILKIISKTISKTESKIDYNLEFNNGQKFKIGEQEVFKINPEKILEYQFFKITKIHDYEIYYN